MIRSLAKTVVVRMIIKKTIAELTKDRKASAKVRSSLDPDPALVLNADPRQSFRGTNKIILGKHSGHNAN